MKREQKSKLVRRKKMKKTNWTDDKEKEESGLADESWLSFHGPQKVSASMSIALTAEGF